MSACNSFVDAVAPVRGGASLQPLVGEDLVYLGALLGATTAPESRPQLAGGDIRKRRTATATKAQRPAGRTTKSSAVTDPEKADKSRQREYRKYHARQSALQRLRDEVAALETALHTRSKAEQDAIKVSERSLARRSGSPIAVDLTEIQNSRDLSVLNLRKALEEKRRLQRERAQLRRMFAESCHNWRLVRDLVATHHKLHIVTQSSFILIKPLTVAECHMLRESSMKNYELFHADGKYSKLTESVCGWKARRGVHNRVVKYVLEKTNFKLSADFLAPITWRIFTTPQLMCALYPSSLEMQLRVVQAVDNDNVVLLKEYVEPGVNNERIHVKCLYLLTRFRTEKGHIIAAHALGSDRLEFLSHPQPQSDDERIVWNELNAWVHKEYSGPKREDTVSRLTGITTAVGKDPSFWVRQVVHSLLAGDKISFGSRFTLPKSTDE